MNDSIKNKFLKNSISLILLISIAISVWSFVNFKNLLKIKIRTRLNNNAMLVAAHIDSIITEQKKLINLIAQTPLIKNTLLAHKEDSKTDTYLLNNYLSFIQKNNNENIYEINIVSESNKIIASTATFNLHLIEKELQHLDTPDNTSIIGPKYSKSFDQHYLIFKKSIVANNQFIGTLFIKFSLKNIFNFMSKKNDQFRTEETYLINKKGLMISPSRFLQKVILKQKVITPNTVDFLNKQFTKKLNRRDNNKSYANYRNARVYGANYRLQELEWLCVSEINRNEALNPLRDITIGIIILSLMFCIASIFSIVYIFSDFTKTINIFKEGIKKIAAGDLDHKITIKSNEELNVLAEGFNQMAVQLKETNTNLKKSYSNLEQKIKDKIHESENAKKAALSLMQDANMEKEKTKLTLNKLQYTNQKLRNLSQAIEQSPIIVIITDINAKITYANPKFTETTGYTQKEILGKNLKFIIAKRQNDEFYQKIWDKISHGHEWKGVYENQKKNDEIYWEQTLISPVFNEERKITHYMAIIEDISLRKIYEEALKEAKKEADDANQAKSLFLTNMNHEIRTPMNAIIGMTHLALKADLPEKEHGYIEKIKTSTESLLQIVNNILDYSKIESKKIEISDTNFYLSDIFENISNILAAKTKEKKLEFLFNIKPNVPNFLKGDPARITQILLNIVSNAIKFTHQGRVIVSVDIAKKEDSTLLLQFAVSDTGIGMTADQINKLFVAFSQADTSTTRKYDGTGLGLFISQKLVKIMNGDIWVKSEKDKGSTFFFTVETVENKNEQVSEALKDLNILIVDDSEPVLDILQEILNHFSCKTKIASSASEAMEKVKTEKFDILLTDWHLPDCNATEMVEKLNNKNLLQDTKIILISGYENARITKEANDILVKHIIYKPFTISTVYNTILNCVKTNKSL